MKKLQIPALRRDCLDGTALEATEVAPENLAINFLTGKVTASFVLRDPVREIACDRVDDSFRLPDLSPADRERLGAFVAGLLDRIVAARKVPAGEVR